MNCNCLAPLEWGVERWRMDAATINACAYGFQTKDGATIKGNLSELYNELICTFEHGGRSYDDMAVAFNTSCRAYAGKEWSSTCTN